MYQYHIIYINYILRLYNFLHSAHKGFNRIYLSSTEYIYHEFEKSTKKKSLVALIEIVG